jgi:hypothetical protein
MPLYAWRVHGAFGSCGFSEPNVVVDQYHRGFWSVTSMASGVAQQFDLFCAAVCQLGPLLGSLQQEVPTQASDALQQGPPDAVSGTSSSRRDVFMKTARL